MSQSQDYGFCPNCGAVSRNGVCSSCGYKSKGARFVKPTDDTAQPVKTVYDHTNSGYSEPAHASSFAGNGSESKIGKNGKGYVGLAVASIVVILTFVSVFAVQYLIRFGKTDKPAGNPLDKTRGNYSSAVSVPNISLPEVSVPEINTWDDEYFENFALKIFYNIDSFDVAEETAYAEASDYDYAGQYDYYVYDDYIRTDLNYKILNKTWKYNGYYAEEYGEDYPDRAFIRCDYPVVESDSLSFTDDVNDTILDLTTYMCDYYELLEKYLEEDQIYYGWVDVYVPYMTEDVLSLLFTYEGYFYNEDAEDDEEPELVLSTVKTVNIDMKTGEPMEMPKLSMDESAFLERFLKDINEQNEISLLEMTTMEDLQDAFESDDILWFFNPLGVEFVYTFPDLYGYFSCTEDPSEFFVK